MSRVYKSRDVILGEEKLVKLQTSQIIKFNNEKKEKKIIEPLEDRKTEVNIEVMLEFAQAEAAKIIDAAKANYNELMESAQEERETIISDAYTEGNKILENARLEGYKQGLIEGKDAGLKEMDALIEEATEIKHYALSEKETVARELEKEIVELVIFCVKKVINHEIQNDHQLLLNLVEKGIDKCTYTDSLIIRVSTSDYDVVNASKNKIYMMTEGIDRIEVKKDPALEDGRIIIETVSGTVDASLQTQITQIEQIFYDISRGE